MIGTPSSGSGDRVNFAKLTSAAVVEVAWEEGKLSLDGVPTPTAIRSSCGRGLRTTRLITTDAAWLSSDAAISFTHLLRRCLSTSAPTAPTLIQPRGVFAEVAEQAGSGLDPRGVEKRILDAYQHLSFVQWVAFNH